MLKDHRLVVDPRFERIRYERRPAHDLDGRAAPDLHDVWIWLEQPFTDEQLYDRRAARARSSRSERRPRIAPPCAWC